MKGHSFMCWSKYICLEALFYTSASRLKRWASAIPLKWIRLLYWWPPPPPQPPHPRPLPNLIYPGLEMCQVSAKRRWKIFKFEKNKTENFLPKIWWIGFLAVEKKCPINRKIFHFSNFFKNTNNLSIGACNCSNFQTKWIRWKLFQ